MREEPYFFEISKIEEFLKREKPKKVLIQVPDGLKKHFYKHFNHLKRKFVNIDFIFSADPAYGACFIPENEAATLGIDAIIHVGHTEYYRSNLNIIYVNAFSNLKPSPSTLNNLASHLKAKGITKVGLSYVIQHKPIVEYVKKTLEDNEINVFIGEKSGLAKYDGQVIGCDYSTALKINNLVDAHIIICGGYFHAIGLGFSTQKPVIKLDPYINSYEDLTKIISRYLRIRYSKIMKALDARKYGIISGARRGQYRIGLIKELVKLVLRKGLKYEIFSSDILTVETLRNMDSEDIDVYVVTSCPRLPIDDLWEFEKPVLTPGEAFMVLEENIQKYRFPW